MWELGETTFDEEVITEVRPRQGGRLAVEDRLSTQLEEGLAVRLQLLL